MREQERDFSAQLRGFRRRVDRLLAEQAACWGTAAAGVPALALVIAGDFGLLYLPPLLLPALIILGALIGVVYTRLHPASDLAIALAIDRRLALKERVSTAVALAASEGEQEFCTLVTADAESHLADSPPQRVFPRTFARPHYVVLVIWMVVLVAVIAPDIPWLHSPRDRTDRLAIQEAGQTLQARAAEMRKRPELSNSEVARRVAENMEKLGVAMQRQRLPKKEALRQLNKLDELMSEMEPQLESEAAKQAAETALEALKMRTPREKAAARRALQQLAHGIPLHKLSHEERAALTREQLLNTLHSQLKAGKQADASHTLQQLAGELDAGQLTPEQRKALEQMMQRLENAGNNLRQLPGRMQMLRGQLYALKGQLNGKPGEKPGEAFARGDGKPGKDGKPGSMSMLGSDGSGKGNGNGGHNPTGWGGSGNGPTGNHDYTPNGAALDPQHDPAKEDPHAQAATIDILGAPGQVGKTRVSYTSVYQTYRNRAEAAVESEQVPPDKRRWVKEYFRALDPANQ